MTSTFIQTADVRALEHQANTWQGERGLEEENIPGNNQMLCKSLRKLDQNSSVVASDGTSYSKISSSTALKLGDASQRAGVLKFCTKTWIKVINFMKKLKCKIYQQVKYRLLMLSWTYHFRLCFHFWPCTHKFDFPVGEGKNISRLSRHYKKTAVKFTILCSENRESTLNNLPVIPAISVYISSGHFRAAYCWCTSIKPTW